jgi:hypothetical protein
MEANTNQEVTLTEILACTNKAQKARLNKQYSISRLKEIFTNNDIVTIVVNIASCGRDNMSAQVKVACVTNEGLFLFLTYHLAQAYGMRYNDKSGTLTLSGLGTDRKFLICDYLAHVLDKGAGYESNDLNRIANYF